jgi:hypothetical protein
MEPIRPIEPRSRWESPLAPAAVERLTRERREQRPDEERRRRARTPEPADGQRGPDEDGNEGRHVDVRA